MFACDPVVSCWSQMSWILQLPDNSGDTITWQVVAGVGYAFKWGDVILDYRYLYYSQDNGKAIRPLVVSAK